MSPDDLSQLSMLELFRMEADTQVQVLTSGLLALEHEPSAADQLESCMRAAHSLKGAARIIGLDVGVRIAHAMEDCFVAGQQARIRIGQTHIDRLLCATDILMQVAQTPEDDLARWEDDSASGVGACLSELAALVAAPDAVKTPAAMDARVAPAAPPAPLAPPAPPALPTHENAPPSSSVVEVTSGAGAAGRENADRVLRVTAEHLNRLLGLASESLVEARWVKPFAESLLRLKRIQHESCTSLERLRDGLPPGALDERVQSALTDAFRAAHECQQLLARRLAELEMFDRRSLNLSTRLYDEALACRMRPFADGTQALPRMVRDLAQTLGKQVRFELAGEGTQVDRDVLARLDAPLGHLLRNAIDHGIEPPEQRRAAGKSEQGFVRLEARHSAGALHVTISDDGRGVDLEKIRAAVVERGLLRQDAADGLSSAELFDFLFLPGFTMKTTVTDISGRGVGLDVVQDMVKQLRGVVRISSERGRGTRFLLQLPVTLSVVRTLLAQVGGEPYAFPLAHIVRTLRLPNERVALLEGRQHFDLDGRQIGLVAAHQVLGVDASAAGSELSVIVLGDQGHMYGLVVDRFLGERELVVQPLDPKLGKIKDIAAGALMEDGSPVLIVDPEDLIRSTERLVSEGRLTKVGEGPVITGATRRKRVLVVDDSLTVRELERKLLVSCGYDVEVAVDGMDGWNAARMNDFDLIVTDIDMPRMDGIELVELINADPRLKSRPVMIVSYKDRDEDRRRGLEAGAAYYLAKGSFQGETLVQAVIDLIGEAAA